VRMRLTAVIVMLAAAPVAAQTGPKIAISLEARSEGRPDSGATAAKLLDDVRRGFEAIGDVDVVPGDGSRRTVWIVAGTTPGAVAASVMVTERYDRETLMVLGVEDEDMAFRMMALQIAVDHQIFTGRTTSDVAKRIVAAINGGVFARMRARSAKP
jgi:hypothetical protein